MPIRAVAVPLVLSLVVLLLVVVVVGGVGSRGVAVPELLKSWMQDGGKPCHYHLLSRSKQSLIVTNHWAPS